MLILDELAASLPDGSVLRDPEVLGSYRYDWSHDLSAGLPAAVVRASETADVQAVLRWASRHKVAIVPRGAGTSLAGGASAVSNGVTLSLERMQAVAVDPVTRVAIAQPGATTAAVKEAAAEHGLYFAPDPAAAQMSTIGGNAATDASGLCCAKYGTTGDYVLGMQVVLADGTAVRLGGPTLKDVAGLSLAKLFVGSEGTLGVITELTLRLVPPPHPPATMVAVFSTVDAAVRAALDGTARMRPAMLELMDNVLINAAEDKLNMGLDRVAGALLLGRSDAPGSAAAHEMEELAEACARAGATEVFTTSDVAEGDALCAARGVVFPAMEKFGALLVEDVCVPIPQLPALMREIGAIAADQDVHVGVVAHAADGAAHPIIAHTRGDATAEAAARRALGEIVNAAVRLGGTLTGESGVGRLKARWLTAQLGPDVMALTGRVKAALDPDGILNPGVILAADDA